MQQVTSYEIQWVVLRVAATRGRQSIAYRLWRKRLPLGAYGTRRRVASFDSCCFAYTVILNRRDFKSSDATGITVQTVH